MSDALTLGIAGCGRIVQAGYVPALGRLPELEVVAVADPVRDRRERVAAEIAGAPRPFASVGEMLEATRPEAVLVASPPSAHLEHATGAADAGAVILVEKPPGRDLADAEAIARLRPRPWIGFNRRFSHLRSLAGRLPGEGTLDVSIAISYRRRSWRAHEVRTDALADLGPHAVDLARRILEGLDSVRAAEIDFDRAELDVSGSRGRARIICATNRPWTERIEVRSAGRRVAASLHGGLRSQLRLRRKGGEHPLTASLAAQMGAFAAAAAGDADGLATAADGVAVMRALEAVRRSASTGCREVRI